MSDAVNSITSLVFGKPATPDIPEAQIPAAPAPTRREDTGANIVLGADAAKDQRVSGGKSGGSSSTRDVLGSLGRGGLNI